MSIMIEEGKAVPKFQLQDADDNLVNDNKPIINPVDSPIVQGLAKITEQRRIKLKKFNYKFTKPKTMGDLESEPAYKRAGISLDDEVKNSISSSTLSLDDGPVVLAALSLRCLTLPLPQSTNK